MSKRLKNLLGNIDRPTLEKMAYEAIDHLIEMDEVRFDPDMMPLPYWEASGVMLDGSEADEEE